MGAGPARERGAGVPGQRGRLGPLRGDAGARGADAPGRLDTNGTGNVALDGTEPLVRWQAQPLRGTTARVRLHPGTDAYSPGKAVGGFHRPYGGPQLWVSAPTDFATGEWLRLDWEAPQTISSLRLVFDDDVDVELNTLHHHRTPEVIFPELVRDYVIEAMVDGTWQQIVATIGNRRRQRVHVLTDSVETTAVRLSVSATNGVPQARVISLRAYGPDTGGWRGTGCP